MESSKATAPGVAYIVGDKPFFSRTNTVLAGIRAGITAEAVLLGTGRKRVEVLTADQRYVLIYDSKKLTVHSGGGRAKRMLRAAVIGALKTMDFLEARGLVRVTLHYEPSYPLVALPSPTFSTATAMAVGAAMGSKLGKEELWKIAFETERIVKKVVTASVITTAIEGGIVVERWGHRVSRFNPPVLDNHRLMLVHSGREGSRKQDASLYWSVKIHYDNYLEYLGYSVNSLTTEILEALVKNDVERFGKLLNLSHSLLRAIDASTLRADDLVTISLRLGALGAKLVKLNDGFILAVAPKSRLNTLKPAMEKRSRVVKVTEFSGEGVMLLE